MVIRFKLPTMGTILLVLLVGLFSAGTASADGIAHIHPHPRMLSLVQQQPLVLEYHNGALLKGNYSLTLLWYGSFSPAQRAIIVDFFNSLSTPIPTAGKKVPPTVASWWRTTESYKSGATAISVGRQVLMDRYPLGKTLTPRNIRLLATPGRHKNIITVVLTAADVSVEGFCMSSCGSHGSARLPWSKTRGARFPYIWVGNSATQCPGQCAWPFHRPIYGPQSPPLVAPNRDVGIDGMVINLATLVAGTVTNPYDQGFFQGPKEAPLEAVSACTGMFGSGAFPGYPGNVLTDPVTKASYNAVGIRLRKYLLPAMWNPKTSQCATLGGAHLLIRGELCEASWPRLESETDQALKRKGQHTLKRDAKDGSVPRPKTARTREYGKGEGVRGIGRWAPSPSMAVEPVGHLT
ncbi:hypothetical protein Taro_036413 [Colocasia esculenta]|uniref:Uncharacterized protein n=1 Tax=Colocasia esculenta TaxID=4460 RepID=A0A843WDB2_COLES|nr:hypothetical protein [Colocasia esculenta]